MNFQNTQERELLENRRWYQGAEDRLEYFFKNEYTKFEKPVEEQYSILDLQQRFWKTVGGKIPRVHSGLPKLITKTKVNLITANGFDIESEDESAIERLWEILNFNEFDKIWQSVESDVSWSGRGLFRIYHELGDKLPRIEKIDPSGFEVIVKRGKVVGITFVSMKDDLETRETLRLVDGRVNISYEAFRLQSYRRYQIELPLEMKDYATELPFDFLPFELINNTIGNSRFANSPYGESDYTAVQSLFHALDSLLSHGQLEVSSARAIKIINENILKKDSDGHGIYDDNETVIMLSATDMEKFDVSKHIDLFQPNIRVSEYDKLSNDLKAQILAIVGISPVSTGLAGFESVVASAESQREREKASLRTREHALNSRRVSFRSLFSKLLKYDDYLNGRSLGEYEALAQFSDYSVPTLDEKVDTITKAVTGGVMDVYTAVWEMFPNKSESEIAEIVFNVKLERGIPLLPDDYERAGKVVPTFTPPKVEE